MKQLTTKTRMVYMVLLLFGLLGMMAVLGYFVSPQIRWIINLPCPFYTMTGYLCPLCGGTRSLKSFIHGQFHLAFRSHIFAIYLLVISAYFMTRNTLTIITHGKIKATEYKDWYHWVGIGILVIEWLVKNFIIWKYGIMPLPII